MQNFPEQEVAYNMRLLDQAGYLQGKFIESKSGNGSIKAALAIHMTSSGHELLDTIRNHIVWEKIKDIFKIKNLDMTFHLVIAIGKDIIKSMIVDELKSTMPD